MAAYFFDSSALVKRFAKEQGTAFMLGLFRPAVRRRLIAAQFTEVEVCATLAHRLKAQRLTTAQADKARKRFRRDFKNRFTRVHPNALLLEEAVCLATTHAQLAELGQGARHCRLFAGGEMDAAQQGRALPVKVDHAHNRRAEISLNRAFGPVVVALTERFDLRTLTTPAGNGRSIERP